MIDLILIAIQICNLLNKSIQSIMKKFNLLMVFILATITFVQAQIPRLISYQGVLTDQQGAFIPDGTHSLTLKIYDVLAGGSAVWGPVPLACRAVPD